MITDASGRVRQTYLEWKLSKRPIMLDICPPAPKSYRNLKIHHWDRGGGLYLPEPVYEATTRAATGVTPEMSKDRPEQTQAVTDGEHRHNVLQALLRCHARTSPLEAQGACGEAEAWVIGSHNHGITDDMLRSICPGAIVDRWSPNDEDRRRPMWEKAAEYVVRWCQEHPKRTLRVIDLAEAMATRPQHIQLRCQNNPSFQIRLEFAGIEDRRGFRLRVAGST